MNLALITQDFPPEIGGIETYAKELADRFARHTTNFLVIAPDKPDAPVVDHSLDYSVYRIHSSNAFLGLRGLLNAPLLLKNNHTETVFHTQWQTLPLSLFSRKQGLIKRIFVAAHARELLFNPFSSIPIADRIFENYKQRLLAEVDCFFPVSGYTADLLRGQGVEDERIKVVINGTDPARFHPGNLQKARKAIGVNAKKILLTITRLVSRKGVDIALRAFKKVLGNHPDSCYVIVGEGDQMKELQNLAIKLEISDAVHFTGRVPYNSIINYYNACDVFVMPSKTKTPDVEGFGIVFLEANACSKPVVGTFSGGIPSAIVNGETGILVPENDVQELFKAIDKLFNNKKMAAAMGQKGRMRVKKEANWDAVADKLLKSIKDKILNN